MKSNKALISIALILAAALLLGIGFGIGYSSGKNSKAAASAETAAAKLQISVIPAEDAYTGETIRQGNSEVNFSCIGLTDAAIRLEGTVVDLESALREGKISLAELSFLAQSDAQAGFCTERWESENGLARFCYAYPDFDLWIIHDIYEPPDGQQHLIQDITLCTPGSTVLFPYNELDQEDWGIEFSVAETSPSEITLSYTQSGGQQIGQLMTCGYEISRLDPMEPIARLDDAPLQEQMPISMDSQGALVLDIETYFGALPTGKYGMYLYLQDIYSEEDVPPLTRNFHDMQCYWVEFSVS